MNRQDRQTHRQDGDLLSLFPFFESRLKIQGLPNNRKSSFPTLIKLPGSTQQWLAGHMA
jgi:hypothetical protein